jgi:Galactose oxidase, central domain
VFVFGGEDVNRRPHGDLYTLNLADASWKKLVPGGAAPTPRSAHVAVEYCRRWLVLFGGGSVAHCYNDLYVLDTETLFWSKPKTLGTPPSPRAGLAPSAAHSNAGPRQALRLYQNINSFSKDPRKWRAPRAAFGDVGDELMF